MGKSCPTCFKLVQNGPNDPLLFKIGAQEWSKLSKWLEIVQMVQMVKYGPTPSNLAQ